LEFDGSLLQNFSLETQNPIEKEEVKREADSSKKIDHPDIAHLTQNIKLFIEQEKLKLITHAVGQGINEQQVEDYLKNNVVCDTYLNNLKVRMGVVEKKAPRVKKSLQTVEKQISNEEDFHDA